MSSGTTTVRDVSGIDSEESSTKGSSNVIEVGEKIWSLNIKVDGKLV